MNEELKKIIKEIEDIQIWGFEDCPQRFQVTNAIKDRCIRIVKKHMTRERRQKNERISNGEVSSIREDN